MKYASLPRRIAAYFIDSFFIFAVYAFSQFVLFTPLRNALSLPETLFRNGWYTELYTLLTVSLPAWLAFAGFESSRWQGSPGKKLLGIRTVDAASGERVSFWRALVRIVIKFLPWEVSHLANNLPTPLMYDPNPQLRPLFFLVPVLIVVYLLLVLLTPKRQSLHDLVAKTAVVK